MTELLYYTSPTPITKEETVMVERKIELRRRRSRHEKLNKLKDKLASAKTSGDKEAILTKIKRISPWWKPQA